MKIGNSYMLLNNHFFSPLNRSDKCMINTSSFKPSIHHHITNKKLCEPSQFYCSPLNYLFLIESLDIQHKSINKNSRLVPYSLNDSILLISITYIPLKPSSCYHHRLYPNCTYHHIVKISYSQ